MGVSSEDKAESERKKEKREKKKEKKLKKLGSQLGSLKSSTSLAPLRGAGLDKPVLGRLLSVSAANDDAEEVEDEEDADGFQSSSEGSDTKRDKEPEQSPSQSNPRHL